MSCPSSTCKCSSCLGRAQKRDYYHKNRERIRQQQREKYADNKETYSAQARWHRYGLTEHQYLTLLVLQDNKCAICRVDFDKTPHVDHDHTTGRVRGLLCMGCNRGLGYFDDNPVTLNQAADYLLTVS